jgi:hypothetical protein
MDGVGVPATSAEKVAGSPSMQVMSAMGPKVTGFSSNAGAENRTIMFNEWF